MRQRDKRTVDLLRDMRDYSLQAQRILSPGLIDSDPDIARLALERVLGIVGEAASQLPPSFREAHPEILWHQIIGMRNVLVHGYATVDFGVLRRTVTERLPELLGLIEPMIAELEQREAGDS